MPFQQNRRWLICAVSVAAGFLCGLVVSPFGLGYFLAVIPAAYLFLAAAATFADKSRRHLAVPFALSFLLLVGTTLGTAKWKVFMRPRATAMVRVGDRVRADFVFTFAPYNGPAPNREAVLTMLQGRYRSVLAIDVDGWPGYAVQLGRATKSERQEFRKLLESSPHVGRVFEDVVPSEVHLEAK